MLGFSAVGSQPLGYAASAGSVTPGGRGRLGAVLSTRASGARGGGASVSLEILPDLHAAGAASRAGRVSRHFVVELVEKGERASAGGGAVVVTGKSVGIGQSARAGLAWSDVVLLPVEVRGGVFVAGVGACSVAVGVAAKGAKGGVALAQSRAIVAIETSAAAARQGLGSGSAVAGSRTAGAKEARGGGQASATVASRASGSKATSAAHSLSLGASISARGSAARRGGGRVGAQCTAGGEWRAARSGRGAALALTLETSTDWRRASSGKASMAEAAIVRGRGRAQVPRFGRAFASAAVLCRGHGAADKRRRVFAPACLRANHALPVTIRRTMPAQALLRRKIYLSQ